jgi:siroheme decarboxylase
MTATADNVNARLLVSLQKGLPIDARPFAGAGAAFGLGGDEVIARVRGWFDEGVARRFGAVFDSRSLGYSSTLCAADIPVEELPAAAARIAHHSGITHCYERDGRPNLWFTLTAPADGMASEFARVCAMLGPYEVLNLPALRKFKIEAVFGKSEDAEESPVAPRAAAGELPAPLSERERRVVRVLQRSIPVVEDPFGAVAGEVGYDADELLALLLRWKDVGIIRRIGLIVRHRRMGFSANSMCVWPVAAGRVEAAGAALARNSHVTHCYERPSFPSFPFNIYAMTHAKSREETVAVFEALGRDSGLSGGRMFWSLREFKKASPVFFSREAILFAAPGASSPGARAAYDRVDAAAACRFPGIERRWTYTSAGVRRKLADDGVTVSDPANALAALRQEGVTHAAVLPLHVCDGSEYRELAGAVAKEGGMKVALGRPLFAEDAELRRALAALLASVPASSPGDAVILVAHGSRDPHVAGTFAAAAAACREISPRLLLGTILGEPSFASVLEQCRAQSVRKIWLLPCMAAAGPSSGADIAGPGAQSWKSRFERAGIESVPLLRGLGECPGVVDVWMDEAGNLLGRLTQ